MSEAWLIYLALGLFAGFMAGLLGVGGGLIIVPVLAWWFSLQGFDGSLIMHMALGTSLATITLTSLSSVYAHHRLGNVDWQSVLRMSLGLVAGALLGAWFADGMDSAELQYLFGVFEIAVGCYMLVGAPKPTRDHHFAPRTTEMGIVGSGIGFISSLLGIGGGTLTVPYLSWRGLKMQRAVAVAAAAGFPIAVGGAVGYLMAGWQKPSLPEFSVGYLYLPAFVAICAATLIAAPAGAKCAHAIPSMLLKKIFALFLLLMGIFMLMSH